MAHIERIMAENSTEGVKAPPGVPQAAAEISQLSWGGKNPLESLRGQLADTEAELDSETDPEGKDPDAVVGIMLSIHNMEPEKRETYSARFQRAVDILKSVAEDNKLLNLSWKISIQRKALREYDQNMITKVAEAQPDHPELGENLQGLLDKLDTTELFLNQYNNTFADNEYRDLYSEEEWDEFQNRKQDYEKQRVELRQKTAGVIGSEGSDFFLDRDRQLHAISIATSNLERERLQEREEEIEKRSIDQDPLEQDLERKLLIGEEPGDVPRETTFADQIKLFGDQKLLEKLKDPTFDTAVLEREEKGLSWYFHEARKMGVFGDLETVMEQKYIQWANSISPHQEISQLEMMEGLSGRTVQKSYPEVETEVIAFFKALLDPNRPDYVEDPIRWDKLERRGVSPALRQSFSTIRVRFVERALNQVLDSLENLDRERRGQPRVSLPERVSGEWNVHLLEREIKVREQRQALDAEAEPLYRRESYYKVTLLGKNRQEIELGADQAAEDIMKSINDFDIQAIQIRTQALVEAIQNRVKLIQVTERVSQSEAQAIVDEIKDSVTNKVDFHLLEWGGQNLQVGFVADYLAKQMQSRGAEKLTRIPAMSDGWVGIALHLLKDPQFRFHHRPQGWKGQMKDDDTTHKYLRGNIQGKIAALLMEYELKGRTPLEKSVYRERLTKARSWEEFMRNFQRKGLIPINEINESYEDNQMVQDLIKANKKYLTLEQYLQLQGTDNLLLVPDLENPGQFKSYRILPLETYKKIEQHLAIMQRSSYKNDYYDYVLDQIRQKGDVITPAQLDELREAREARAAEYSRLQNAKHRANSAVTNANQVLDIFGESAELGDPSIVMENGDFISLKEVVMVYKFAILEKAKVHERITMNGREYFIQDTQAFIRWRSRIWIESCFKAAMDVTKAREIYKESVAEEYRKIGKVSPQFNMELAEDFEDTGLTNGELQGLKDAIHNLNKNGYRAVIGGVKFADIIKMENLKPVKNNYLADYKSSMSQYNSEGIRDMAAKGLLPIISRTLGRLGLKDRQIIEGTTTQDEIDEYTQLVEDSRYLDAELERLVYFEATHGLPTEQIKDPRMLPFSARRIDYGFQGSNWAMKRLLHLKAFWFTNLRRTTPREVDLIHAMPFSLGSLADEMAFDDIEDLAWNINTAANGLESVDNPALVSYANRIKIMAYIRSVSEGGVDLEKGKGWGQLEKPLVDANSLWELFQTYAMPQPKDLVKLLSEGSNNMSKEFREKIVEHFMTKTLGRFSPIINGTEKLFGEERQATSSGAGFDENEKFALRFIRWLISDKKPTLEHGAREEGGWEAYPEIQEIIRLIVTPNSYEVGSSIWDETWRKLIPSHNIRLPKRMPEHTYVPLVA